MRMYKLREQRLKEFYSTGEMIQTETTSKRSSTRTHTESIADQGFMTMKTKEIRDSESPTNDYQRQLNSNKNDYVSSKREESDGDRGLIKTEYTSVIQPTEEFANSSYQTSVSSSTASKWQSSQTTISVSEEVQNVNINSSSTHVSNEQNNENRQSAYETSLNERSNEDRGLLTFETLSNKHHNEDRQQTHDVSSDKHNSSNIDSKVSESITSTSVDNIKQEDNSSYSNANQTVIETYTNAANVSLFEPISENISNQNGNRVENTRLLNVSTNKSKNIEVTADNSTVRSEVIDKVQKLDSCLSEQKLTTELSTNLNTEVPNEDKSTKKTNDQTIDSSTKITEGQYTTTYKDSYQQPRISVDLSPSHEAFARSLRSTPERSSSSPGRERMSPERRLKSVSPEKYRTSPEKSGSPPKSLRSATRRKLSSSHTKDISKKRSNTPTRREKYDSSDDSDCSGATHGTYDKYKGSKKSLFKEETKITSTSKYYQKSPSTSPVRREKSPGYSSEGSVGKEVRKSSSKTKVSSHESSPERSAFKPVKNYRTLQTHNETQNDNVNRTTQNENVYINVHISENKITDDIDSSYDDKHDVKDKSDKNTETTIQYTTNNSSRDLKNKSIQEKFIIEEQVSTEQVDNVKLTKEPIYNIGANKTNREKSPTKNFRQENKSLQEKFIESEKPKEVKESTRVNDVTLVKPKEKSPVRDTKSLTPSPTIKSTEKTSISSNNKSVITSKKITSAIPSSVKKSVPSTLEKTPSKKNIMHKDSKDNLLHKTVKKDLSREKMDIKVTRNDSKTLLHKNSKDNITSKTVVKKPNHDSLIDKKTTISFRNKVNSFDIKPKVQEPTKVIEKKDSKNILKPSISPQSSQKKLGVVKSGSDLKSTTDSKTTSPNPNTTKISSINVSKLKTFTPTKSNLNETSSKGVNLYSKTISTSAGSKKQITKTTPSNLNKTPKIEVTKNIGPKSKDLEDELPPDNFESDTDLDDSTEKPKYLKENSSSSSSSSSEDDTEEDKQKIKDLNRIRNKAEEEYGRKMTNKDALLNVVVQLPPSSRESSPDYSARFGQPYCSVSDDASLPRYADVVSEPEELNDNRLNSNRYDVVTDLDEEINVTVADRVSKFLHNVNKQEEIKTTEIPQSPLAVRKAKQMFESIAKGQIEEETDAVDDDGDDADEPETIDDKVNGLPKTVNSQPSLLTRKISGASDYKTRKEFFEKNTSDNRSSNTTPEKSKPFVSKTITRSSSIKDRRASFEAKVDRKTPLKDKTNVARTRSPEPKKSSPERTAKSPSKTVRTAKSPSKTVRTEVFDVRVEEVNRSRRLSGSKTVKDRTANFESNAIASKSTKENKTIYKHAAPVSTVNTVRSTSKTAKVFDANGSERVATKRVTSPNRSKKSPESTGVSISSARKTVETASKKASSKSPERKAARSPEKNVTKSPDRSASEVPEKNVRAVEDNGGNGHLFDSTISSRQRVTSTTVKTDFGETVKSTTTPKTAQVTTKSISVSNTDDDVQIEDIFDLHVLEIMVNKYDFIRIIFLDPERFCFIFYVYPSRTT